ncbi:MAG: hypothetical protein ACP5NC_01140 [Nitrososphaeria archaeon]
MRNKNIIEEISKMKLEDFEVIYDYVKGLESVNPQLKGLLREKSNVKGLEGIGALLIAIPDPFTDVPGVVLLLLAKIMEKNKGANIKEIYMNFNSELDSIKDFI